MSNVIWRVELEPFEVTLDQAKYETVLLAGKLYEYLHKETSREIREDKMLNFKEVKNE